jgi:hypothetical protein
MSGIIPPSIVNYEWTVKTNDNSFLNVSFPFRVKITSLWFTTQQLWNGTDGLDEGNNIDGSQRELKLAAIKAKNSKTQHSVYDPPTDYTWGFSPFVYDDGIDEDLKPTMWLGNPDDAPTDSLGAWVTGGFDNYWSLSRRSTAKSLVETNNFYNDDWNQNEYNANTYVADVAIMNTDEMLQLFVYNSNGNWGDYENDAKVTISIAYTGAWAEDQASATPKEWTSWWND